MTGTHPTLKSFRERPRAVCLCVCSNAQTSSVASTVHDARLWFGSTELNASVPSLWCMALIQGRIEAGDVIGFQACRKGETAVLWNRAIYSAPPVRGVVHCSTRFTGLREISPGMYTLTCRVNGRMAGKVELEVL